MELLPILRLIWRRRILLGAGLVVSLALALGSAARRQSSSALAWTRVNLDTPKSQLVNSAPGGADTLPWRASLLIHLMATDATQRRLAQRSTSGRTRWRWSTPRSSCRSFRPRSRRRRRRRPGHGRTVRADPDPDEPCRSRRSRSRPPRPTARGRNGSPPPRWPILESQSSLSAARYSSKILTGGGVALKRQPFVVQQVAPIRAKPVTERVISPKQIGPPLLLLVLWTAGVLLLPALPAAPAVARGQRRRRAGVPAQTSPAGTGRVTTAPMPTTAPAPTTRRSRSSAPAPM